MNCTDMARGRSRPMRPRRSKQHGTAEQRHATSVAQSRTKTRSQTKARSQTKVQSRTAAVDHFGKLPAEIMVEIFTYLPDTKSRVCASCVSRVWRVNMMEPKLWEELILHGFTKCSDYTSRDGVPRLPRGIAQVISRAPQQKVRNVELSIGQRASVSIMNTIWKHASNHVHSLSLAFTTTHPRYGGLDLRRHLPAFHQLAELKLRGKCVDYLLWDVDGAEAAPLTLPAQLKKLKLLDMESKIFQTEAWNIRGSIEGLECSGNRIWMTDLASFATTLQSLKVSNACLDYGHRYDSYRPVFLNMFVRLRVLSLTTVKSRVVGPLPVSFQTLLIKNCHVRYDFTAAQISFKQWMEVLGKNRCYGFPIDTKEERYVWDATNVLIRRATSEEEDENGSH